MTDYMTFNPKGVERLVYVVWVRALVPGHTHLRASNPWYAVGAFPNEVSAVAFSRRYQPECVRVQRKDNGTPLYRS